MNPAALSIQFSETHICIGEGQLLPQGRPVVELTSLLGPPNRIIPLYHKGILQSTLHVYDQLGLRFWSHEDTVGEVQVVLKTTARDVLPVHPFSGHLVYQGQVVPLPASETLLTNGYLPGFVRDDDAARWGMISYAAHSSPLRYYAIVCKETDTIESISVS